MLKNFLRRLRRSSAVSPTPSLYENKYRSDIDGLRGVAILSVITFHAFPSVMTGGFAGVDIFFVISGYLISTILCTGMDRRRLNLAEFYSRRIRRIFPALLLVLVSSLTFGWFFLLTDEYTQLGKHIAAGAGFVSNFALWQESGYFDNAAETKPLLHLWSLGIEEQFYIVWPVLLWGCKRKNINLLTVTLLIAAASFALNVKATHKDALAAFYLPQTRFWELMVGSLLAYLSLYRQNAFAVLRHKVDVALSHIIYERLEPKGRPLRDLLSITGAALVITGFFAITKEHFPGWWALLPTIGSAFIISAGMEAWFNRTVLSSRVLVWFGLISFPLYLWHWPLLSFAHIMDFHVMAGKPPTDWFAAVALFGAVVLAWLTYKLVERPIRFGGQGKVKTVALLVLMMAVGATGYGCYQTNGFEFRPLTKATRILADYNYWGGKSEIDFWGNNSCFLVLAPYEEFAKNGCEREQFPGRPKVFLVGDSHSAYLSQGLRGFLADKQYNLFQFSYSFCTPLSLNDKRKRCQDINRHVFDEIAREKPDILIIFAHYPLWTANEGYGETIPYDQFILEKTEEFKKEGIKKVLLIGPVPAWEPNLPYNLARKFILKHEAIPLRTFDGIGSDSLEWDQKMREKNYPDNTTYLSLKDFLCDSAGCLTRVGSNLQTDLIVWDNAHFTKAGADYVTRNLLSKYLD